MKCPVSGQNPFEILERVKFEQDTSLESKMLEGVRSIEDFDSTNAATFAEENFLKLKALNPFEVTHIPLAVKKVPSIGQIELKLQPKVSNTFIFWIMLFSWALLGLVLGNRRDILPKLFQSIFNENMLKLIKKQDGERLNLHFIIMYFVFFINASVFIYLISKEFGGISSTKNWFLLLMSITTIYIIRHILLSFIGWVFPIEKEVSLFSFLIMVLNLTLGLFLIPVNLFMAFGNEITFKPTMVIGLIIIGVFIFI
ncbi:MAG TPA: DUF4271 domain-containing protein, partial [Saprospiraceae bacterium]|nr:DUF4271 domain-containing protein [Saprospiraceae bacterium]